MLLPPFALLLLMAPLNVDLVAPAGAPPDTALTWRAWAPGLALEASAVSLDEQVGAAAPRRLEVALAEEGGRWTLLVEGESGGDAWFALAFDDTPRVTLAAVPAPRAELTEDGVRVSWEIPAAMPGLAGWQVLRSSSGREPELVGVVGPQARGFRDDPPAGEHAWMLRPALPEGVCGPEGRASDPLMIAPPGASAAHEHRARREAAQP